MHLVRGSGTLNLDDKYLEEKLTKKFIEKSMQTQLSLLKKALHILKAGQEMVYSTCSILSCENEEIVQKVLKTEKASIVPIELTGKENLPLLPTTLEGTICIMPTELYEGFFVVKIRKER